MKAHFSSPMYHSRSQKLDTADMVFLTFSFAAFWAVFIPLVH